MINHKKVHAFTLIELALVLTIIGLLVGGILGGQAMVRTAEVNSTLSELTRFANGFRQFTTTYNAMPGDMSTATNLWGASGGSGSDAACFTSTAQGKTATCNGNGDRAVSVANAFTGNNDCTEWYLAWQHLANAGLIYGTYTGRTLNSPACGHQGGINSPAGKIQGMSYMIYTSGTNYSASAAMFDGYYEHLIYFGGNLATGAVTGGNGVGIMVPDMMEAMDRKGDDGMPSTGNLRASKQQASCWTTISGTPYYNVANSAPVCYGVYAITQIQ